MKTLQFNGPTKVPMLKANNFCRKSRQDKRNQRFHIYAWADQVFEGLFLAKVKGEIASNLRLAYGTDKVEGITREEQAHVWAIVMNTLGYSPAIPKEEVESP